MDKTNREILNIIYRFDILGNMSIIEFYDSNDVWLGGYYFKISKLTFIRYGYDDLIKEYLKSVGLKVKD